MDRCIGLVFVVSCMTSLWTLGADGAALNDYILDYEPMEFDHMELREQHSRVKREADPVVHFSFSAYDRTFNLHLEPAQSVFTPGHFVSNGHGKPIDVDTSHIYDGYLIDNPSSSAHLAIMSDSVMGFIHIPGDTTYHIESAKKHKLNSSIPSIIYPENKMNMDPYKHLRSNSCGNKELFEKLDNMSRPLPETYTRQKRNAYSEAWRYSREANLYDETLSRKKRAALDPGKRTCNMFLRADQLLFNHIKAGLSDTAGGLTAAQKAKEEILSMFSVHVKAITRIYETTNFVRKDDNQVTFTGIRFKIQRTEIIDNCDKLDNGYCTNNLDVSNFLDLTSKYLEGGLNSYCLAATFTYRDFIGGTLGLAWVATPTSGSAGVCGKYGWISDENGNRYKRSLNTGVVTLINFGRDVPSKVSQLTLAHEVGHNFGSKHDPTTAGICSPFESSRTDASKGNYIMFPSAAQGNLEHNDEFSICSKDYIAKVLETVGTQRADCFVADNSAFCGNRIVEGDEECDCGFGDVCETSDLCCIPNNADTVKAGTACKRASKATCSPSEGRCCKSDCTIESTSNTVECQEATDCRKAAMCDGVHANCTAPVFEDNYKTFCDGHSKTCEDGECSASVCKNIGWAECMAEGVESQLCFVSCRKNESAPCVSSADATTLELAEYADFKGLLETIKAAQNNTGATLSLPKPPGSNCDNFLGYCDILSKCSKYDAEGPFKQLTDLIFDPMNFEKVADWITDHWWAVLLMCVGFVIFMGVFVWLFSYNTPSKDPKKVAAAQKRAAAQNRPQQAQPKRSGAYSVDVPMQERRGYPQGHSQGHPQGHVNQGYQHPPSYPPQQKGQYFDRISQPRRY